MTIILGEKIGEGRHRIVYEISKSENYCVKVPKAVTILPFGIMGLDECVELYNNFQFRKNFEFNEREFGEYQMLIDRVPDEFKKYFATVERLEKSGSNYFLVCQTIRDNNGKVTRTLHDYGNVRDKLFWEKVDKLRKMVLREKIPFMGVHDKNIGVRVEEDLSPVFWDFKRVGFEGFAYPLQFWNRLPRMQKRKIERTFERLNKYKSN